MEITADPVAIDGRLPSDDMCGAVVEFVGVIRSEEQGEPLEALEYEAYDVMARSEMRRILTELSMIHPCRAVSVHHRVGRVAAGEAAIVVRVEAVHRAEAFAMLAAFMDRLKQDVPIWKRVT